MSSSSPFSCTLLHEEREENKPQGIKDAQHSPGMEMCIGEPISNLWGTQDPPLPLLLPNMAVGFGANAETRASENSWGATLGMSGYADRYLMLFLWCKMQITAL